MKSSARPRGCSPEPPRPVAPPMSLTSNLPARWWPTCAACGLAPSRVVGQDVAGGGVVVSGVVVVTGGSVVVTGGVVVVTGGCEDDGAEVDVVTGRGSWLTEIDGAARRAAAPAGSA